jgi:hypothetical protein
MSPTGAVSALSRGVMKARKRRSVFAFVREQAAINWVALMMLTGDRAKYLGLIFTIAFSSFLIAQQLSIFYRILT